VQRIDSQTLTILTSGESKPEAFAWNSKETKFLEGCVYILKKSLKE